jgi:hypothetical protein
MDSTPKWLWPAVLAAAAGLLLWWLFEPDETGNTGLNKLRPAPPDPYAGLGAAACLGGVTYFGGTTGGMAGAPLCAMAGQAVAPVLKAGVNTAVDIIDAHGKVIATSGNVAASAIQDGYDATKKVSSDVYAGGKTVVKDTYNFGKDAAGWVSGVTPAKKIWNATLGRIF